MKATSLNKLLKTLFFITLIIIIGGFYCAQNFLRDIAHKSQMSNPATITDITMVQELKIQLSNYKTQIKKASDLTTTQANFRNQTIDDVNTYATKAGISIDGYDTTSSSNNIASSVQMTGIMPQYITVTFKNPVPYANFLQWIKYVESNIPKMQVTGIDISSADTNSTTINVKPLTIEVFTK